LKTKLTGKELSDYLESKNVGITHTLSEIVYPPDSLLQNPNGRLYAILPYVKNWIENICKLTAKTNHLSIELGFYLETVYKLWKSTVFGKKLHNPGNNG